MKKGYDVLMLAILSGQGPLHGRASGAIGVDATDRSASVVSATYDIAVDAEVSHEACIEYVLMLSCVRASYSPSRCHVWLHLCSSET